MTTHRLLFFFLSILILAGCNDVKVPLGPAGEAPMDPRFEGRWELIPEDADNELVSLRIIPFNEHEYFLEYRSQTNPEKMPDIVRLRAYTTLVEGVPFANIKVLGDNETDYLIAKYDVTPGDTLIVRFVEEGMDHIETSEQLYAFVRELLESGAMDEVGAGHFRKVESNDEEE